LESEDWQAQLNVAFERQGTCRLSAPATSSGELRKALVRLIATPVDVGYLQFFPLVERVERLDSKILATLSLRERV
jgi:hypothetical protein